MKWVTWKNIGVDRMACAWLIRRSIDADAEFLFIERNASWPDDAEPFDIPGVRLSHHDGHCSFFAFLHEYSLNDPVLDRLGRIIDEADTIQSIALEPAAAGLDLICNGIRRISSDDFAALTRGEELYNSLYAQIAYELAASDNS